MSQNRGQRAPVERSQRLLRAARLGEDETVATCWTALAEWNADELASQLSSDDARTAFWLNVYNAAVQDELRSDPSRYESRLRFFVGRRVTVAGHGLSLNDIEHGILRRSRSVFFLGYGPRILQDRFERTHRVDSLDPRIHFALNCGAASCPPIASYSAAGLDDELARASESYLTTEVDYELDHGVIRVPQLFLWYRGDFGGRSGIRDLLREYGRLPVDVSPTIRYKSYDWSLELDNVLDRVETSETSVTTADGETASTDEPSALTRR
jgi:hypothetical protein